MAQSKTGTSDANFDLVSCLYHALEGAAVCEQYLDDAREQEDEELESLYAEWQALQTEFAEKAKGLLADRLRDEARAASKARDDVPDDRPDNSRDDGSGAEKARSAKSSGGRTKQPRSSEPRGKDEVKRRPPAGGDKVDEASWESFPASDPPASY